MCFECRLKVKWFFFSAARPYVHASRWPSNLTIRPRLGEKFSLKEIRSCHLLLFFLNLMCGKTPPRSRFFFSSSSDGTDTTNNKCILNPPCKHESRCRLKTELGRASHYYCNCSSGYEGHQCHQGEATSFPFCGSGNAVTHRHFIQSHSCRSFNPRVNTTAFDTSSSTHLATHTRNVSSVSVLSLCRG